MTEHIAKNKETFEYKAEMKQLLQLIIHSLYTHPEIFIRELISNSSDALNKIRFKQLTDKNILGSDLELKINIDIDSEKNSFSISDTGIGMSKKQLIEQIGTVAKSGTKDFIKQLEKKEGKIDGQMIGQFGVGFYSAFMVTDKVIIETRASNSNSKGYRWESKGDGKFNIEETDIETRGTKISFKLKENYKEFSDLYNVKEIIKKYSSFVDYPIYVNGEKVNELEAIWQKNKKEVSDEKLNEFYKFISNDFEDPFDSLHLSIEGAVNFKALIYVPKNPPQNFFSEDFKTTLHLYTNKVFIQNDSDELLPDYLKFLKGVVDTSDLPLNVSREVTQHSPAIAKIKDTITNKVIALFEDWAKNDVEKYNEFYSKFGTLIKTGINYDFKYRDRLIDLTRFSTNKTENQEVSLIQYINNNVNEKKEIYYISAENYKSALKNPQLEYFNKKEIEVLILTDPIDVFVVPQFGEYKEHKLIAVDKADIDTSVDELSDKINQEDKDNIISKFKSVLGERVSNVVFSSKLVESPVSLGAGKEGLDPHTEKMMKILDKNYKEVPKELELNPNHKLILKLTDLIKNKKNGNDEINQYIEQLYDSALLLQGKLENIDSYVKNVYKLLLKNLS